MNAAPHYLLLTETEYESSNAIGNADPDFAPPELGRWRFILEQLGSSERIEASDLEPNVIGERLQLLAVVRGLEALDQPSHVTLVTSSRYVGHGIERNMIAWRKNDFHWERFGKLTPIKNRDLWLRVDQAMKFHKVECRTWQFDSSRLAMAASIPVDSDHPARAIRTRIDQPQGPASTIKPSSTKFGAGAGSKTKSGLKIDSESDDSTFDFGSKEADEPRVIDHQNRGRQILARPRGNAFAEESLAERIFKERMNQRIGVERTREMVTEQAKFVGLRAACGVAAG